MGVEKVTEIGCPLRVTVLYIFVQNVMSQTFMTMLIGEDSADHFAIRLYQHPPEFSAELAAAREAMIAV